MYAFEATMTSKKFWWRARADKLDLTIKEDDTIRLPLGLGKVVPVATIDVAEVCIIEVLASRSGPARKPYRLTGPKRKDVRRRRRTSFVNAWANLRPTLPTILRCT
jgi:hypothetical protein